MDDITGIGSRLPSESVVGFRQNGWTPSVGITGRLRAEYTSKYIEGNTTTHFPFHEIFKATMLGQWVYYKEERSDCLNLFDSHLGAKRLRLLRLSLLHHVYQRAKRENTVEVQVAECTHIFSHAGASSTQVITALEAMRRHGLIRSTTAEDIVSESSVVITRSGGYYLTTLARKLVYVEACMFDTAIEDGEAWSEIADLTIAVSGEASPVTRMKLRRQRLRHFLAYLQTLESNMIADLPATEAYAIMNSIREDVLADVRSASRANGSRRRRR